MWAEKKGINRLKRFEIMYKGCTQIKNTTKVKSTSEQKGSGAEWTPHLNNQLETFRHRVDVRVKETLLLWF